MDALEELESLIDRWRREIYGNSSANPISILTSIAELIERETEIYLRLPIDPFDDRHPCRTCPESSLGPLLKALFKEESFMNQLTGDYLSTSRSFDLHVVCCRLLLDSLPGLDSSVVFKESEDIVMQLLNWAERADFPLHAYATGLLAAAMEDSEISVLHREKNNQLVPLMFNRLNQLTNISSTSAEHSCEIDARDLVDVSGGLKRPHSDLEQDDDTLGTMPLKFEMTPLDKNLSSSNTDNKKSLQTSLIKSPLHNECSSSSWAETHMSGSYQMHPLSVVMQQRFILQYLSALGEYQELLVFMFEHKALSYILHFIDGRKNQDIRLAFDALKFLASFIPHKKFALEFLDHGGLPQLLRVNRHGMASSGVSICLYYLAYNEDVMERICWMKRETVERMVSYGLWLLECSHDSSRAYATMFFAICFQFPLLIKLFDKINGLRKLLNVILMRGLLSDDQLINELSESDELLARRQTAKQVCVALKKYTRAHFISETRRYTRMNVPTTDQECKPTCISDENVMEAIELHRNQLMPRFNWRAIDKLVQEDGIKYLLKIIAHIFNDGTVYPGRSETIRNALEIIVVCSLCPRVQQLILKEVIRAHIPYPINQPALACIVMCADPKIPPEDADWQKSTLNILINLVCCNHQPRAPAPALNASIDSQDVSRATPGSGRKKERQSRSALDLALRKAIWDNNGTLILPNLLTVTSPLTEADTIRSLACRVLCGLAKEESIRQIMSKLPLFVDGQLQSLMKEPILPEKRIEHASFCSYSKQLIELVTGTPVIAVSRIEPSGEEIKRQKVVAQTKIRYDKIEAYHLVHNFLNSEGFSEAAAALYKEANLSARTLKSNPDPKSLQIQKSTLQPSHLKKLNDTSTITLDSIFTEYLRHQHSLCKNPVAICPPFELLSPHRCPEPTNKLTAPKNITSRIIKRRVFPPKGGVYGEKYDRHYVYSKFRPIRVVRDSLDVRTSATCCAFSSNAHYLFVGTEQGLLKVYNMYSGIIEASYECHSTESALAYVETSREDNLLLTVSPESPPPQCILWTFTDIFERKHRFDNDIYAEFGKASSDRIITTQELFARLWDTATGSVLQKYEGYHRYNCNRATLNYSDTLVLNDGVLWDVRTNHPVHRFGKFNEYINGIFHPNGNEIICNAQVWDIRNFQLLRTEQAFDMCQLKFNSKGDVIFSTIIGDTSDNPSSNHQFKNSFRTFDSYDYSTIATIDLKRTISDLTVSSRDEHIALVESSNNPRYFQDDYQAESNICRLYEVGRPKYDADMDLNDDDEDADDEENEDDDDDDDDEDDEVDGRLDYDEDDFDDVYDTDDMVDEDEIVEDDDDDDDDDTMSHQSRLSSSINSPSEASHDEILPFYFSHNRRRASDMEEEEDESTTRGGRNRGRGGEDDGHMSDYD